MRRLLILVIAVLVLLAVLFIRQPIELRAPEITEEESGYQLPFDDVLLAIDPLTLPVDAAALGCLKRTGMWQLVPLHL